MQTVECNGCGRVAAVYCGTCRKDDPRDLPFELIAERIQDIMLRWCGERATETTGNVLYALRMERDRLKETPPERGTIEP